MADIREQIIAELEAELGYAGLPHERAADRILDMLAKQSMAGFVLVPHYVLDRVRASEIKPDAP